MKNDRSSYIGLFIIGLLIFGWMWYQKPSDKEVAQARAHRDSVVNAEKQQVLDQQSKIAALQASKA
ncbi:MAG TPA: hypothetical protein VK890_06080, partial [Bacteroidia bacterium]|nr:hypothetical protein [Bacteroidia bacterium]